MPFEVSPRRGHPPCPCLAEHQVPPICPSVDGRWGTTESKRFNHTPLRPRPRAALRTGASSPRGWSAGWGPEGSAAAVALALGACSWSAATLVTGREVLAQTMFSPPPAIRAAPSGGAAQPKPAKAGPAASTPQQKPNPNQPYVIDQGGLLPPPCPLIVPPQLPALQPIRIQPSQVAAKNRMGCLSAADAIYGPDGCPLRLCPASSGAFPAEKPR
jgi:hypothetical protein